MKLYGYYRSSASYRIRIILNLKGLAWDYVPVRLDLAEHRQAPFRAIHPAGFVPVLEDGPHRLGQSMAIAEFLEERYPTPALLPPDPVGRALVRELQGIIGCDVHPLQNLRILKYLRAAYDEDDEGVAAWCRKWIAEGLEVYETLTRERSADGRYSVGDRLTFADAWLIPQVYNANRFSLDLEPYPTIRSIAEHCTALEAVAAAHPGRQPEAPEH